MCGIAGFVDPGAAAQPDLLKRMLRSLEHRGPDALSGIVEGGAALGAARLSIVDLEGGKQPAYTADRKVAVVFNGEIFNFRRLRRKLMADGHRFDGESEVETLLQLYLAFGEAMFDEIRGQFAIAIWDGRRGQLLLCRDRVGIRPLYWTRDGGGVAFASEIKALAQLPGVSLRIDKRALLQTFRFWTNVNETSAFAGVHQIPPGHYLRVGNDTTELVRYWEWPVPGTLEPLRLASDNEYQAALVEELDRAVKRQAMADVPVASYLSGGIDSSAIAHLFSTRLKPKPLRTYSVGFEDPEYDETEAQQMMVEANGFDHVGIRVASSDIAEVFPEVVRHAETMLFRTAPAPLYLLSRRVRSDGYKVVMTGEGADEVLLGYDMFRETKIRRFWGRQPDSKWRGRLISRLYSYLPQYRNPRYLALLLDFYRPFLADTGDPHFAMAVRWANGKALEGYFGPALHDVAATYDPLEDLEAALPSRYLDGDDIDRAQCIEGHSLLANYLLSSQGDRMSMAHSVETRYPYLDEDFIAFAARLPRSVKLRGLRDKYVLREAFSGRLPEAIARRPKVAYQAPDLKAFFIDGSAPDYVNELLDQRALSDAGYFNPERVALLVKKARTHNLDRVGVRDNMAFVLVLSTMLLYETFVKGSGATTAGSARHVHLV